MKQKPWKGSKPDMHQGISQSLVKGPERNPFVANTAISSALLFAVCRDEVGYTIDFILHTIYFLLLLESAAINGTHLFIYF